MTEEEFEVLDQVYFIIGFKELQAASGISEGILVETLKRLLGKGWIKLMKNHLEVANIEHAEPNMDISSFQYLATKAGLFAHNSR